MTHDFTVGCDHIKNDHAGHFYMKCFSRGELTAICNEHTMQLNCQGFKLAILDSSFASQFGRGGYSLLTIPNTDETAVR